ncbi:MAG: hypothetical protein LLG05_18895 [Porphyromonadaceae bacterium]|nr:hypothetical protein [Porphyromonadaceae bacterium]
MRIEVYKDWIIRSTAGDKGVTLCKSGGMAMRKSPKTNEDEEYEVFKNETYPKNVERALEAICDQEIIDCRATTFKGLQTEIRELKALIKDIGRQLGESEETEQC